MQTLLRVLAQDFLYLLEITRFVHDVLQLEKLFLAVLMNEQRLRLGGGCAVVVLRVKSLFAGEIFETQIASSSWTPSGRKLGLPQPLRLRKQCQGMLQRVLLECSTPDSSSEGC